MDRLVADYLGVEDAFTVPMGFATNSMNIPTLVGKVYRYFLPRYKARETGYCYHDYSHPCRKI
jgi:hypothetical protein